MKILNKKNSDLLSRIEIEAEIEHTQKPTPSEASISDLLSKELKMSKENIIIKHIISEFGGGKSKISAYAYKDKDSLNKIEKKAKKQRKKELEKAKKEWEENKKAAKQLKEEQKVEEPKKEEIKENGEKTDKEQKNQ